MQKVILYIEGQRIELFKDESVSLTQTIQNVKDIGSIFTDFSKSFSVPASSTNNKIFKHYYNFNIENGFNANDKKSAEIYLNSFLFRKGYIALNGVSMKNNSPDNYKITFFGETVDLKKKLKEVTLQNIYESSTGYDTNYNIATVKAGLTTSLASGNIIYPLISHTERFYYDTTSSGEDTRNLHYQSAGTGANNKGVDFTDLKPALKLSTIITQIENYTAQRFNGDGLVFERTGKSFFNIDNTSANYNEIYDNMFLWLAREKGLAGKDYTGEQVYRIQINSMTPPSYQSWNPFCYTYDETAGGTTGSCSNSEIVNGIWTIRPRISYDKRATFGYRFNVVGSGGGTFSIIVEDVTGQTTVINSAADLSADGTTSNQIAGYNLGTNNQNSSYRFVIEATSPSFSYTCTVQLDLDETIPDYYDGPESNSYSSFITTVAPTGVLDKIIVSDQMPKMGVLPYLTSLFKMFNLTAFVQEDGKIMVQTLDSYYEDGNTIDISEYVDTRSGSIDFAPPYEEIAFRNSKPKTFFAINFLELNNTTFGDLENSTSSGGVQSTDRGSKYVVKTGFEKILYERLSGTPIQWGWSVDINQLPVLTAPMIFVNQSTDTTSTPISFIDGVSDGTASQVLTYNRPSNSINIETINFGSEIDEFTGLVKTESLFAENYLTYISGIFNYNRRLTTVKAFLPLKVLVNYSLADLFVINGNKYNINSINTNLQTGESKLELYNLVDLASSGGGSTPPPTGLVITVNNLGTTSVEIDVSSYTGGGQTDIYEPLVNGVNNQDDFDKTSDQMRYTYTGLTANTTYTLQIKGVENNGTLVESSNILTVSTST